MTSQHIKHHKLQKLLRPSGIVFLINITAEEKEAGIDNVSTVSTLLFKITLMTFRHSTCYDGIRHQPSDAVLKLSWVTLKKPSCRSVDIKVFARSSRRWSHKRGFATKFTRMTPEAAVPRAPDTNSVSTFTLCLPLAEKVLESTHLSWFHNPFQSIQSKHGAWTMAIMNIWIYEYMNIWINNYDIVQALKTSHPLWSVIHWGTDMECMFLLIGAHQHVQVKAFRLALATSKSGAPFFHSNHSQPEELQQLGEWAPDTTRNSANSDNSAQPTSKPVAPQNKLCFTVVQNP